MCLFVAELLAESEDNAETNAAAVHLLVSFRDTIERILFDHRMHIRQRTELERVL